jgi:hypothetical protein
MTIIIGDAERQLMVSDSQVSDEDSETKSYVTQKIFKIPDGWLGGAGDFRSIQKAVEWFNNGKKEKDKPEIQSEHDADFMMLTSEGLFVSDKDLEFWKVNSIDAIGSGQAAAMGAVRVGADIEDAAYAATLVDLFSGGDVVVYSLKKAPTIYKHG